MINNNGRTLSLPVPSSLSSSPSTDYLQQCVNTSTFGEVGGGEWEMLTSILQRQRDVVIKPQQEELQNRLLLMKLPQSELGGGCFNNFLMSAAAAASIGPSSSVATLMEQETCPPLTVAADTGMDGLSMGILGGARRECFKKRKTRDKALIPPPTMKEEEAENGDEAKKRARGGCCVQVQQVKKNTDDQQLCKNGNSNGGSPSNETNRDNKILAGEQVSGCTTSKENNIINSRVEPQNQKPDYIHVRARRGQATDSHSLAERVRREKISERMKYLQDLVPGCNKIIGKAGMLDEIINYVQSLQRQVEVLCSSNYQSMPIPIPSEMGHNPGLNILYNPTTQHQTGLVSGFEMVMNEGSDHMGLLRRTISAPVSLPAAAATGTHQHLDLEPTFLTEDICRLSWDNGADLLQSIYSTMEEFHPERAHQQQQQFSEADYLKMEIQ